MEHKLFFKSIHVKKRNLIYTAAIFPLFVKLIRFLNHEFGFVFAVFVIVAERDVNTGK